MRKILLAALLVVCLVSVACAESDPAIRWLYSFTATQDATQAVIIAGCKESEGRRRLARNS